MVELCGKAVRALEPVFEVNPQLDIPIYQQLVDKIRAAVKKGDLTPGQQLPTVQEMSQSLSIARGTIKRAYDELEHQGVLEKIQGRGTFIRYQPEASGSRKERAMAAIDGLLDELEEMGFSSAEINIFLTLKQRERTEKQSVLKVAAVECNPENLSQLSEQLRSVRGMELHSYLLDTIEAYPYNLDEDVDLVITTAEHGDFIESILADSKKIARVALRLSLQTFSGLVRCKEGDRLGILSFSSRFGDLMYRSCRGFAPKAAVMKPRRFSDENIPQYLEDKDYVAVPADYGKYCTDTIAALLEQLEEEGRLIPCAYEMDEGSFLHLEERLRALQRERNS